MEGTGFMHWRATTRVHALRCISRGQSSWMEVPGHSHTLLPHGIDAPRQSSTIDGLRALHLHDCAPSAPGVSPSCAQPVPTVYSKAVALA
mmetsp:Transcript_16884/g.46618  ORF Transcript_16884/g.46618 Transcript_16884/m.46618 type:complete len:90 (-) Transcript_16884:1822-2091(-)